MHSTNQVARAKYQNKPIKMEKSKTEQYLERLQKWREQKKKEKEEKARKQIRPFNSRTGTAAAVKPPVKVSMKSRTSSVCGGEKIDASTKARISTSAVKCLSSKKATPTVFKKAASKPVTKRKSEETRELLEKLNKWKEEKKSEKKQIPRSTVTNQTGSKVPDKPFYKQVRSRLFDYESKCKSNITHKEKENVNLNFCQKTITVTKTNAHKTENNKTGVRRRHSEIQKSKIHSKPPGILKRKSCFGSFDLIDGETGKSSVKKRCTTVSATEKVVVEGGMADIPDRKSDTNNSSSDILKPSLTKAVVTPGASVRNVRFTTPPNGHCESDQRKLRKTPKTPSTRSAELSNWLKAKGRTPSKFRHLMCFHAEQAEDTSQDPHTKNTLSVDELSKQMDVIEQERLQAEAEKKMHTMLDECMILYEAGCPMESIVPWLDDIYKLIPCSRTSARFYTCKAHVIKYSLDLDAVLEVFEQATINNAQPKEEIAKCLTETLKYVTEEKIKKAKKKCNTSCCKEVQQENVFESTAVVYTVSNVTPFSDRKRSAKRVSGTAVCQVVTPVRRSTRRSLQNLPESLKDKKKSFSNLDDIKGEDILFQPNLALDPVLANEEES